MMQKENKKSSTLSRPTLYEADFYGFAKLLALKVDCWWHSIEFVIEIKYSHRNMKK